MFVSCQRVIAPGGRAAGPAARSARAALVVQMRPPRLLAQPHLLTWNSVQATPGYGHVCV